MKFVFPYFYLAKVKHIFFHFTKMGDSNTTFNTPSTLQHVKSVPKLHTKTRILEDYENQLNKMNQPLLVNKTG
jgi:hypothetical protein